MFELGYYRHGAALVLQSKAHAWVAYSSHIPEALREQRPSCGISCCVHSLFSHFLKMTNYWILVALHLSHTHSTITSELDNTNNRSHNTDNSHNINLLRLPLHPLTLGYCRQRQFSSRSERYSREMSNVFQTDLLKHTELLKPAWA